VYRRNILHYIILGP